jgi:DNA repair protein RecN (Recombination protein N)
MIISLSIENFALIEKLNIDFSKGFSIITGETGAGKSILLGALGLVLGKRADLTSLKNASLKPIFQLENMICNLFLKPMIWIMKKKPSFAGKYCLRENQELL